MGYKQELRRNFTMIEVFGMTPNSYCKLTSDRII
jgi:hypothetical protein